MILTGICRLGRDAEIRYTPDNKAVANLSLAYNHGKKDADGKRETQWISASLWGERAEKLVQYLTKGTLLSVVLNEVHIETYDRKDGGTGTNLKGMVSHLEFAGGKREDGDKPAQERTTERAEPARSQPANPTGQDGGVRKLPGGFDQMMDDIPFLNIGRGISGHAI